MTEPRDILEALFVGDDVDGAAIAQAGRAASEDAELRALFDGLAAADRELGGDFEQRFGEAWFLDSLDAMLAEENHGEEESPAQTPEEPVHQAPVVVLSERRRFTASAVVLAAAAAVVLSLGVFGRDDAPHPEFQARSAVTDGERLYDAPAVEVFCVKRTADGVEFVGAEQSELATVRCAVDHEIKLAVRNPDARLRYAAFVGLPATGGELWYGPSPASTAPVAVPHTTELRPVGETIRLDVNHTPGSVRLVGIFSENALDFATVGQFVEANAAALRDGTVDFPGGTIVRQTFEVTP